MSDTPKQETIIIPSDKNSAKKDLLKELENVTDEDAFDNSPTTGDNSNIDMWAILAILSFIICIASFIYIYRTERHNSFYNKD